MGLSKVSYKRLFACLFMIHRHTFCLLKLFSLRMCNRHDLFLEHTDYINIKISAAKAANLNGVCFVCLLVTFPVRNIYFTPVHH